MCSLKQFVDGGQLYFASGRTIPHCSRALNRHCLHPYIGADFPIIHDAIQQTRKILQFIGPVYILNIAIKHENANAEHS
jgi:hypothetical protein